MARLVSLSKGWLIAQDVEDIMLTFHSELDVSFFFLAERGIKPTGVRGAVQGMIRRIMCPSILVYWHTGILICIYICSPYLHVPSLASADDQHLT